MFMVLIMVCVQVLSSEVDSSSKDLAADSIVVGYEDFVEVIAL